MPGDIGNRASCTAIVVQTGGESAKVRKLARMANVALLVPDGGQNLVVYGSAEVLSSGADRRGGRTTFSGSTGYGDL